MTTPSTRPCPHCRAPIPTPTVGDGMVSRGAWLRHVRVCVRRGEVDRAYFRSNHRWPRRKVPA